MEIQIIFGTEQWTVSIGDIFDVAAFYSLVEQSMIKGNKEKEKETEEEERNGERAEDEEKNIVGKFF